MARMTNTQFAAYFFSRFSFMSLGGLCLVVLLQLVGEKLFALVAAAVFGGLWVVVAIACSVQMLRGDADEIRHGYDAMRLTNDEVERIKSVKET